MSTKNKTNYPCIYIDETGTDINDPYYGVGFLKVNNPYKLSSALLLPHTRAKSALASDRKKLKSNIISEGRNISLKELDILMHSTRHAEFHFAELCPQNLKYYLSLLDCIKMHEFTFCGLLVNKSDPHFDKKIYNNYWDYHITMVKLLCKKYIKEGEKASLIFDCMTKPKISKKELDGELLSLDGVVNVQMVESIGSPLIQLCDLFIGAVAFKNRLNVNHIKSSNKTTARLEFLIELCKLINCDSHDYFTQNKTFQNNGKYFSIWHLKMRK